MSMKIDAAYFCPYCGRKIETTVDPSAGRHQDYTDDCEFCCRPINLSIDIDFDRDDVSIDARPETDLG